MEAKSLIAPTVLLAFTLSACDGKTEKPRTFCHVADDGNSAEVIDRTTGDVIAKANLMKGKYDRDGAPTKFMEIASNHLFVNFDAKTLRVDYAADPFALNTPQQCVVFDGGHYDNDVGNIRYIKKSFPAEKPEQQPE